MSELHEKMNQARSAYDKDPRSEFQTSLWATEDEAHQHWESEIEREWEEWYNASLPVSDSEYQS